MRLTARRDLSYNSERVLTCTASECSGVLLGGKVSTQRYLPYGGTRDGSMPTDRQFTGQRHETALGFYDPSAGSGQAPTPASTILC